MIHIQGLLEAFKPNLRSPKPGYAVAFLGVNIEEYTEEEIKIIATHLILEKIDADIKAGLSLADR